MKQINSICRLLVLLTVITLPFTTNAQVTFQKTYPTTYDRTTRDVMATPDGGYILVGMTNNSNIVDCDLLIMKTDANGELLWTKTYGGTKPDYAYSMCETTDGNYFVTGYSQSFSGGDYDIYLIKFDPNGDKIWEKTFGSWGNEEAREIIKTSDGNYVIVGTSSSFSSSQDAVLIKIDNSGTALWTKTYGGSNKEFGNAVKQLSDGGFILGGQTLTWGQSGDTYLVRTNSSGDTLWTKYFGNALSDEAVSLVANGDNSIVVAVRDSTAAKDIEVRVVKTDANGVIAWDKTFGGTMKDTPKTINSTSDGGYVIGAISRSFGWINPDMWLLKMDAAGDTTWSRHFGAADHEHCHIAKQAADGGYLLAGHGRSYGPAQRIMFVKLNGSGAVSVAEETLVSGNIRIYPNPSASGNVYFSGDNFIAKNVTVCSAVGQLIYNGKLVDNTLNLSSCSPGVYLITVETEKERFVRKLVIGE